MVANDPIARRHNARGGGGLSTPRIASRLLAVRNSNRNAVSRSADSGCLRGQGIQVANLTA